MKILKNIAVAFSLYSRIPMPVFTWQEDDMKHNLIFLPWIGAVIGAAEWLLLRFLTPAAGETCTAALVMLIPLILTGGFHVDGFMDVQDALNSYRSKEEKLDILKDPHIGAFAVIRLCVLGLIWLAAVSVLLRCGDMRLNALLCCSFAASRCLSACLSLNLPHARKDGMLSMETEKAGRTDTVCIIIEGLLLAAFMLYICVPAAAAVLAAIACFSIYYRNMCLKQFGGVTGDTAGYCTVSCETVILICLAAASFIL